MGRGGVKGKKGIKRLSPSQHYQLKSQHLLNILTHNSNNTQTKTPPHSFSIMQLTNLLFALAIGTAVAEKCACVGGTANSRRACDLVGHKYGTSGCGFSGCCVSYKSHTAHTHTARCLHSTDRDKTKQVAQGAEETAFRQACDSLGYGFLQCNYCAQC